MTPHIHMGGCTEAPEGVGGEGGRVYLPTLLTPLGRNNASVAGREKEGHDLGPPFGLEPPEGGREGEGL